MKLIGPIPRISLCLALLGLSILLSGNLMFGKYHSEMQMQLEVRRKVCEALAVQLSSLISANDMSTARNTLKHLVERNDDVLSAALRGKDGRLHVESGNHFVLWGDTAPGKSTLTHTQVPIYKNRTAWGTVEIRFDDSGAGSLWNIVFSPLLMQSVYFLVAGFFGYLFYMRRTLKHLDPGAVIPPRVKAALDVLEEGVVLVDTRKQIVLANSNFSDRLGVDSHSLLGKSLSDMNWLSVDGVAPASTKFPWDATLVDGKSRSGTHLCLGLGDCESTFAIGCSAVLSDAGQVRGAMVTFNDISEIEDKSIELARLEADLERTQAALDRSRAELQAQAGKGDLSHA